MIKILVPTDFSLVSINAIQFAMDMFHRFEIEMTLLNTYNITDTSSGFMINVSDIIKNDAEKDMKKLINQLVHKHQNVHFKSIICEGELVTCINKVHKKENYNYVFAGTKGCTGLKEAFIGSNTAKLINGARYSLCIIPEDCSFDNDGFLSTALDLKPINLSLLEKIASIHLETNLELDFLTVQRTSDSSEEIQDKFKLPFKNFNINKITERDVELGIAKYLNQNHIALLVVINRSRKFFNSLFHKSLSKKLSMHITTPMLILHD